jgi:hypothetical protein
VSHVLLARIHHKPRALTCAVDPWRFASRSRVRDSGSRSAGRALGAVESRCYTADDREFAAVTTEAFDDADALSAVASAHQSDGLAGGTSSKNAVIIGSRTCTTAEIEM